MGGIAEQRKQPMETNNEERERLIDELRTKNWCIGNPVDIADFIIAERAKIVKPIMKAHKESDYQTFNDSSVKTLKDAIKETLKLSGVKL